MMSLGFDDAPPPAIEDAREILIDRCYPPWRANAVATYCWIWGTTEGCPDFLSDEDRQDIHDLLSEADSPAWTDYDHVIWSTFEEYA